LLMKFSILFKEEVSPRTVAVMKAPTITPHSHSIPLVLFLSSSSGAPKVRNF
jgi:hypothetical protein